MPPVIGVCSWSLRPESPRDLVRKLAECGLRAVQLALDPVREGRWNVRDTVRELTVAGVSIRSGMMGMRGEDYTTLDSIRRTGGVRPDSHWETNRAAARANATLSRQIGVELVTFHAGFLPHDRADAERKAMLARLREIVDIFADQSVQVAFETGQETAETLLEALEDLDRPNAGVNLDPANMILYGMGEPVEALRLLAPRVRQIHIKDARRTRVPGTWGEEAPATQGEVDWPAFFDAYRDAGLTCDLVIERESGDDRIADVRRVFELLRREFWPEGEGGRA